MQPVLPILPWRISRRLVALVEHPHFASGSALALVYTLLAVLAHAVLVNFEDSSIWHPDNWAIALAQILLVLETILRLAARVFEPMIVAPLTMLTHMAGFASWIGSFPRPFELLPLFQRISLYICVLPPSRRRDRRIDTHYLILNI